MKRLKNIDKKLRKSSSNLSKMCKFIKYAMAVAPIIFSIVAFMCTYKMNVTEFWENIEHPFLFIIASCICIFMVIISILYFFVLKEEEIFIGELNESKNLLLENQKIKQANDDLNKYIEILNTDHLNDLTTLSQFIRYINNMLPIIISDILHCKNNPQEFYDKFRTFIDMLYENLNYIYNPSCHQIFTVALYLYDENERGDYKLKPYYSQKPDIIKRGKGRWWKVGDGQIGLTYMNNSSYNYQNLDVQINPKTSNSKQEDDICYVSALSFPIHYKNKNVRGVFCITSNIISAFYNNSDKFQNNISKSKEVCSKIIASMIEMCLNEVFPESNTDTFGNLPELEQTAIEYENPNNKKANDEQ